MSDEHMQHERPDQNESQDEDEALEDVPRRTGGQAEGEANEEDDTRPTEVTRPSQAEG